LVVWGTGSWWRYRSNLLSNLVLLRGIWIVGLGLDILLSGGGVLAWIVLDVWSRGCGGFYKAGTFLPSLLLGKSEEEF
jgi:hypothetical protein